MAAVQQQAAVQQPVATTDRKKLRVFKIRQALLAKSPNRAKECSQSFAELNCPVVLRSFLLLRALPLGDLGNFMNINRFTNMKSFVISGVHPNQDEDQIIWSTLIILSFDLVAIMF